MEYAETKSYVRDLETKLKTHGDQANSSDETVAELRKELLRLKEDNVRLSQHTSEIEGRLSKTEGHSSTLILQIEKHEREALERETAYRDLEQHVALLDTSKDNKLLLESLVDKDQRIADLQKQIEDQNASREEHDDLQRISESERAAQAALRTNLDSLSFSTLHDGPSRELSATPLADAKGSVAGRSPVPSLRSLQELTPPDSPGSRRPDPQDEHLAQLEAAMQESAARCAEAETKYANAEHQIADLLSQLSEARLIHAELDDVLPDSPEQRDDVSEAGSSRLQTPKDASPSTSPDRADVGRRGSASGATGMNGVGVKQRDFRGGRGFGELKRARPQSLSQELSSAQYLESSPRASWTGPSALRLTTPPSRQSLPALHQPVRSAQSLEAELRFVHEVSETCTWVAVWLIAGGGETR